MSSARMRRHRVPPWLRLTRDQVRDLTLCHHSNLDAIARGEADADLLWQWVGSILTWSKVAELNGLGIPEMAAQLGLAEGVITRFRRTGRVGFSGAEYQGAKDGVDVMDALASETTKAKAIEAANWGEKRVQACALGELLRLAA